jgi:hypothetical protein
MQSYGGSLPPWPGRTSRDGSGLSSRRESASTRTAATDRDTAGRRPRRPVALGAHTNPTVVWKRGSAPTTGANPTLEPIRASSALLTACRGLDSVSAMYQSSARQLVPTGVMPSDPRSRPACAVIQNDTVKYRLTRAFLLWVQEVGGSNPPSPTVQAVDRRLEHPIVRRYRPRHCGCSSMAEFQPSKLAMRVRFPSPAPSRPAPGRRESRALPGRCAGHG